jgi:hypothetical protein
MPPRLFAEKIPYSYIGRRARNAQYSLLFSRALLRRPFLILRHRPPGHPLQYFFPIVLALFLMEIVHSRRDILFAERTPIAARHHVLHSLCPMTVTVTFISTAHTHVIPLVRLWFARATAGEAHDHLSPDYARSRCVDLTSAFAAQTILGIPAGALAAYAVCEYHA